MSALSAAERRRLPASDFVFPELAPGSGSYPIPNEVHARAALARAAGTPEAPAVAAAVRSRFPDLGVDTK